jgi:hypothetical protein
MRVLPPIMRGRTDNESVAADNEGVPGVLRLLPPTMR